MCQDDSGRNQNARMMTLDSIKGLIEGGNKELALTEDVLGPDLFRRVSRLLNTRYRICDCAIAC